MRMRRRKGLTLLDVLVILAVIAVLAGLLLPVLIKYREESRRQRCRENLILFAKGMAMYTGEHDHTTLPCPLGRCARGSGADTYNGAEWLATLYWVGITPDPDVLLCPSSRDWNSNGRDIGSYGVNDVASGFFSSQTVSYAGLWWKSVQTVSGGAVRDDFPPYEPMACDDTQGGINHGTASNGGMNVLFFDAHVEFKTPPDVDVTTEHGSVGMRPGFLWRLKN
jgi:prepilin-type processing-associated H-X9-DG protein